MCMVHVNIVPHDHIYLLVKCIDYFLINNNSENIQCVSFYDHMSHNCNNYTREETIEVHDISYNFALFTFVVCSRVVNELVV